MNNNIFARACNIVLSTSFLFFSSYTTLIAEEEKEVLYWVAPMDANYRRDKPGKSPMGMALVPFYAGGSDDGSSVTISPAVMQNLGVRTQKAELTQLWRGIDTVGYVGYDKSKISHIHLRTEGWIDKLAVESEGDHIKKGDFLFDIYSPKLVNAQEEMLTALSSGNKGLIRASKERLSALGISALQIKELEKTKKVKQHISTYASQSGVVSSLPVREGMFVSPSQKVMTLSDLSSVWLTAEVFERQSQWIEVGQSAEVSLSFLPGKTWQGVVDHIHPSLDPKTRTLKVRLHFDNPGEQLKPNMYTNVKIYGGAKKNIVVIPLEALIRTGREQRVIIALGEGKFEARQVNAGMESGAFVEILKGIKPGEEIVVSGQFLIDSEASARASFARMEEPDTMGMSGMPAKKESMMNANDTSDGAM